jgi:hypothetical protein
MRIGHDFDTWSRRPTNSRRSFTDGPSSTSKAIGSLLFAVIHAIEILGEAASKISAETRAANPQLPWSDIVAMAAEEIPALVPLLRLLVESEG